MARELVAANGTIASSQFDTVRGRLGGEDGSSGGDDGSSGIGEGEGE